MIEGLVKDMGEATYKDHVFEGGSFASWDGKTPATPGSCANKIYSMATWQMMDRKVIEIKPCHCHVCSEGYLERKRCAIINSSQRILQMMAPTPGGKD